MWWATLFGCAVLPLLASAQSTELFPRPPELLPAIKFWTRIYTEVDTASGFLHDAQNLSVVYASLPLDRALIESTRSRIQEDLRTLASGRRTNLTRSAQDVLAQWPADVSNETLRIAATNVRWQLGQSDRFLAGLQRSGAYRKHIDAVIREKRLPPALAVLPHVESSFNPGAYSSASAAGMWQFGRATGQRFMRIDHIVDERMDPYMATNAAMSLLEYNYSVLGTWPLALTAYNHGVGGITRAVREMGTTDIGKIAAEYKGRAFGFASRNFYAQFLAVNDVERDASKYFSDIRMATPPNFLEVRTDAFIDAEVFARSVGISLEQLQADNPALRPAVWEGNKRIPQGFPVKVRAEVVSGGDLLALVPVDFKFAVQTPDVAYVVVRGDSLSVIARRFNTTVSKLVALNQLPSSNRIAIGQRLLLPQDNVPEQQLVATTSTANEEGIYTVRRGDTVSLIAARYGVTEQSLLNINGIQDPHRIYPGQRITLPGYERNDRQLAAINSQSVPTPPTVVQFADTDEPEPPAQPLEAQTTASTLPPESPVDAAPAAEQLALNLETLPPAAVLPDNQQLDTPVTEADEEAVALDPELDVTASNVQLSESLSADPSDYSVASNNTIEIQASETLGHYADWLSIRAWDLRRLNNMAFSDPVIIGDRLRLDFSRVNIAEFELKRREFHANLQQEFFSNFRIQDVQEYEVARNDNIGIIARNRYSTPIWLLRQYNPDLDFNRIQIGQRIVFPLLEKVE
jgi:membrane-bound lytic murein transglycosylase D